MFSTRLGLHGPRPAPKSYQATVVRTVSNADKLNFVANCRENFGKQCDQIKGVVNVCNYFDDFDIHIHGLGFLECVLLEIAKQNREKIGRYTYEWTKAHEAEFAAIKNDTVVSDIFSDKEREECTEHFLAEALDELKRIKRGVSVQEPDLGVSQSGSQPSNESASQLSASLDHTIVQPTEIEAQRNVHEQPCFVPAYAVNGSYGSVQYDSRFPQQSYPPITFANGGNYALVGHTYYYPQQTPFPTALGVDSNHGPTHDAFVSHGSYYPQQSYFSPTPGINSNHGFTHHGLANHNGYCAQQLYFTPTLPIDSNHGPLNHGFANHPNYYPQQAQTPPVLGANDTHGPIHYGSQFPRYRGCSTLSRQPCQSNIHFGHPAPYRHLSNPLPNPSTGLNAPHQYTVSAVGPRRSYRANSHHPRTTPQPKGTHYGDVQAYTPPSSDVATYVNSGDSCASSGEGSGRARSHSSVRHGGASSSCLHVGNLPGTVSSHMLHALFGRFGHVLRVSKLLSRYHTNSAPQHYAFVTFTCPEASMRAIRYLNGTIEWGKRLSVGLKHRSLSWKQAYGRNRGCNGHINQQPSQSPSPSLRPSAASLQRGGLGHRASFSLRPETGILPPQDSQHAQGTTVHGFPSHSIGPSTPDRTEVFTSIPKDAVRSESILKLDKEDGPPERKNPDLLPTSGQPALEDFEATEPNLSVETSIPMPRSDLSQGTQPAQPHGANAPKAVQPEVPAEPEAPRAAGEGPSREEDAVPGTDFVKAGNLGPKEDLGEGLSLSETNPAQGGGNFAALFDEALASGRAFEQVVWQTLQASAERMRTGSPVSKVKSEVGAGLRDGRTFEELFDSSSRTGLTLEEVVRASALNSSSSADPATSLAPRMSSRRHSTSRRGSGITLGVERGPLADPAIVALGSPNPGEEAPVQEEEEKTEDKEPQQSPSPALSAGRATKKHGQRRKKNVLAQRGGPKRGKRGKRGKRSH